MEIWKKKKRPYTSSNHLDNTTYMSSFMKFDVYVIAMATPTTKITKRHQEENIQSSPLDRGLHANI